MYDHRQQVSPLGRLDAFDNLGIGDEATSQEGNPVDGRVGGSECGWGLARRNDGSEGVRDDGQRAACLRGIVSNDQ